MKKYYKILGLKEGASREEIETAYTRLSKDLDPKENDNLDFFVEEYALVQDAYKKLTEKDDLVPETENDSSKSNKVLENIKDISKKIPKDFKETKDLKLKEDLQSSNEKLSKSEKTNSNKQKNKSLNTNSSKPNENNIPKNPKKKEGRKIFLIIIISLILSYPISMFFYSKSILNEIEVYYEKALVRNYDFNMAIKDIEIIEDLYEKLNELPFFLIGGEVFQNSFALKGDILFAEGTYFSAIDSYQKAISFNKNNSELYIKLGDVYNKKGYKSKALDYYKKGVKLFKNYDFKQKFKEFYDDKKFLLSIAICDIEINKNPKSFDGYFSKARAYSMNGDDKSAIRENSIALNIKPNYKAALFNHGLYHHNDSKYNDAIEYFSKAIKEDSKYKLAYFVRGQSYHMLKNEARAIKDFNKAIQIDPSYALAYSYRGSSNYYSKKYKKAIDDYSKAKSLDPNVYINKTAFENSNKEYKKQISLKKIRAKNANKIKEFNNIKIGDYINGGIVFYKNEKTLDIKVMVTSHSSNKQQYYLSRIKVNDLYLNGYNDWVLPSIDEFYYISKNHKTINSKGPKSGKYFTEIANDRYWIKVSSPSSKRRYMYGTNTSRTIYSTSSSARHIAVRTFKL